MSNLSLRHINKVHFIGIKGVAMSGLAAICKDRGLEVKGSDVDQEFITDKILLQGDIGVFENFRKENLDWNPDLVVVGASWDMKNPEMQEARKRKLPVLLESDLRGELSREKTTIAVAGVHGKTTTTSLISYIFALAGLDPSYLVGTALIR
ncbi:MAG: UDP-N-acetylmuramate--alanine ligase [Candidatus Berkelbacteria bacterium Licking1014_85]|uniref:UDP-N-acetylmuramate--alanine ligase n=1 Tax=Candidatus Berkelbacteria bacterium Licking1014_85 TaxID=2017148 RepID=A0A554LG81_9BACT|nr:MAG: UDP-N-acetylmuramate--alanine ligase [Candidatus Berkelbacteria bacterium Licking1014_85]